MTEPTLMFKSCRAKLPVLMLTPAMQRDAFQVDLADAQRRRDMRDYHRIEQDARNLLLKILSRKNA